MPDALRRPTNIADMVDRMHSFRTRDSLDRGLGITVRPDDVFISTYSKSGTTWLQQVVHGLRSSGDMDFEEIGVVVPWLESAIDIGIDPEAEQRWCPRAFKAHLDWDRVPKGGRYITSFRDPKTVLPSFHRFFEGWFFEPGTISVEEFARGFYMAGTASGRHWDHLTSWFPQVGRPDVLALAYEDMVAAPDRVPQVVADFLQLDIDDSTMALVTRQSSRDFMAAHHHQFDEHVTREARDRVWGLPDGGETTKVQAAATRAVLSAELEAELDAMWQSEVTPALGFVDYASFRAALPNPLEAPR